MPSPLTHSLGKPAWHHESTRINHSPPGAMVPSNGPPLQMNIRPRHSRLDDRSSRPLSCTQRLLAKGHSALAMVASALARVASLCEEESQGRGFFVSSPV